MSSRAVEQPRRPVPRLLTVLAVLLGLLAMHGLASTSHAHATAQPAASVAAAAPHEHGSVAAAGQVSAAGQARTGAWALPGTSTGSPGAGTCDEHCPTDFALLCLAVLTAAAALAGLARAARSAGTCALRQHLRVRAPTRPRSLPPPIDPVAELCVSRT